LQFGEAIGANQQVSEGVQPFINTQEKEMEETRINLTAGQEELKRVSTGCNQLKREKDELTKDFDSLRTEKVGLRKDVDGTRAEFESFREGFEALRNRGFTQDIVTRLADSVTLNGPEVWRVLESVDDRARLEDEIAIKRKLKDQVEREVSLLDARTQKTKNSLGLAEKKLANIEAKVVAYGEVADLVESGLKAGFKLEDLRALLFFLIEKNIGKTPGQSISHLLQRIEAEKSLEDTTAEIRLAENRLAEKLELEKQAKAKVELIEKENIKAMEAQTETGLKCINDYATKITESQHSVMVSFQDDIAKAKACSSDVGRLEQQRAQLEKVIEQAQVLEGVLDSTKDLKFVPLPLIFNCLKEHNCISN
jgi:hypothetical protein